jgi:hypothetical protein
MSAQPFGVQDIARLALALTVFSLEELAVRLVRIIF